MVLLTIAAVVVSTVIGKRALSPILHVAAIFPFYYSAMKEQRHRRCLALVMRWAAALFVTTVLAGVFAPSRVTASLPFGDRAVAVLSNWLATSQSQPAADYSYILWGLAVFLVGTAVSGGLIGLLVGSVALGGAACGALYLFENGNNVLQIAISALPPWQLSLFACGAFCLLPTSLPFFERFLKIERVAESKQALLTYLYIGAGFFVVSLILRLALAGMWQHLLQRWTIL